MTNDQLKILNKEIWKYNSPSFDGFIIPQEARLLNEDELTEITRSAKLLIVEPHNACMGFGFGITLYSHPEFPGIEPEPLITITNAHLSVRGGFEEGWDKLFPLANNEQNKEWLKKYGFPELREKSWYDY